MPGLWFKIAKLLILHLIEFDEELDDQPVRIGVIDRNVVARTMSNWPLYDWNAVLRKHIAILQHMR